MPLVRSNPTSEFRALITRLGGTWFDNTAMCRCPCHTDRTPSLSIRQGKRAILVTCHAGCDSRDVLRALRRVAELPTVDPSGVNPSVQRSTGVYLGIWQSARSIEGTLAERYVREVRQIWAPLEALRFHPWCQQGKGMLATFEPALVVAMRKAGAIAAIQRIFRDPAISAYTEKGVLGQAIGATWSNGQAGKTIGICEGFETPAAYTSLTGIQAWATMGAKLFHQIEIPASVETVILLADNDAEGRRARDRATESYRRPGLAIGTEWPPGRMNDWVQFLKR